MQALAVVLPEFEIEFWGQLVHASLPMLGL
jgi:hypothetical protein